MSNNTHLSTTGADESARSFKKAGAIAPSFGIHPKTLFRWSEQGLINRYKLNSRVVLFDEREVQQFVESARVA